MLFILLSFFIGEGNRAQAALLKPVNLIPYAQSQDGDLHEFEERDFLAIINRFRSALRLGRLTSEPRLKEAAIGHAEWMSQQLGGRGLLTHVGPSLGWGSASRMRAEGIDRDALVGENIARGSYTAKSTFIQWFFSPEHLEGMLTAEYTHIGVARRGCDESDEESDESNCFWVTDFAALPELKAFQHPVRAPIPRQYDEGGFPLDPQFDEEVVASPSQFTDQELFSAAEKVVGELDADKKVEFENPTAP